MTPQERALLDMAKAQLEWQLLTLTYSEHIFALKSVVFALDHRAQKAFEEQLELEHAKNQKRREEAQMMLESLRAGVPKMPS